MKINADVKVHDQNNYTIVFSTLSDSDTVTIEQWDEWGSITLDDTLYDFHCYVDDSTVGVYVYGLTDADKEIDSEQEYICDMVGDFINDARVWAEFNDSVDVEPHDDVTENFNGRIVGFSDDRMIVSVEDQDGDVWDCSVEYLTLNK